MDDTLHPRIRDIAGKIQWRTVGDIAPGGDDDRDADGRRIYRGLAYGYNTPDRHRTTMLPGAMSDAGNVPILAFHRHDTAPIGRVVETTDDDDGLHIGFVFDEDDPDAAALQRKVDRGFITALSVGFLPDPDELEYRAEDDLVVFGRVDLLEVSLVPVGSHPDATIDEPRAAPTPADDPSEGRAADADTDGDGGGDDEAADDGDAGETSVADGDVRALRARRLEALARQR